MSRYEERPTSKRGRILWVVAVWIVAGPVMFGLAIMMQWWALLVIVPAVLATRKYLLEGGMFEAVDGMGRAEARIVRPSSARKS